MKTHFQGAPGLRNGGAVLPMSHTPLWRPQLQYPLPLPILLKTNAAQYSPKKERCAQGFGGET